MVGMATAVSTVSEIEPRPEAPFARIVPRSSTLHGDVRVDCYDWLRNKNDAEVLAHLEAENAFTDAGTRHTAELQEQLYREILGRIKETDPGSTAVGGTTPEPNRGRRTPSTVGGGRRSRRRRRSTSTRTSSRRGRRFMHWAGPR
jgi:hypothetical protein